MLIVMEGPDNVGKSTQVAMLENKLSKSHTVVTLREPGNTLLGEELRRLLLDETYSSMAPLTRVLMFLTSRVELMSKVIKPALAENKIVILDRYIYSTYAYQVFASQQIQLANVVTELHELTIDVEPDIQFVLNAPPTVIAKRNKGLNYLDNVDGEFQRHLYQFYTTLYEQAENGRLLNTVPIYAGYSAEIVHQHIMAHMNRLLGDN